MGVRGLLKFLRTNPNARDRNKSLAGLAEKRRQRTGQKATIVCDFLSVLFWLIKAFHDAKVTRKEYGPETYLCGGDYTEYSNRFISLIRALRYVCAEPVLFVDAPRGSVLEDLNAKMPTYEQGGRKRLHFVGQCIEYCHGKRIQLDPADVRKCKIYPLVVEHVLLALRSENVKIVYCPSEADSKMAEYACVHPEVCGILTTDTDMVMMRKCTIIHCKFFDRDDTLGITKPSFNEKPRDIICDLITPSSLAHALNIRIEDLKVISILCGNDYTSKIHEKIQEKMDLKYPMISSAGQWLAKNPAVNNCRTLFNIPIFKEFLLTDDGLMFWNAVKHTYKAYGDSKSFEIMCRVCGVEQREYKHHKVPSQPLSVSPLLELVKEGIEKGEITHRLSSVVRCGIYWRVKFIEGPPALSDESFEYIHDLIISLRKVIYMLLGIRRVREYGHFTGNSAIHRDYFVFDDYSSLLLEVRRLPDELSRVLYLVPWVLSPTDWFFEHFDFKHTPIPPTYHPHTATQLKPLVICTVLLYALSLEDKSSTFSKTELTTDVFLATCLMSAYGNPPFKVLERPTIEAMNMSTGFACIIHHVYDIASLLHLLHLLPPPGYLYQPGALVAFHAVAVLNEDTVRTKLTRSKDFVKIHTTYTHLVQLRRFQLLKELIESLKHEPLQAAGLAYLAQAFYSVLGEYHSSVHELEERIEELQSQVITEAHQPLKTKGKQRGHVQKQKVQVKPELPKKKKKPKPIPVSVREDMQAIESDIEQLKEFKAKYDVQENDSTGGEN